MSKRFGHPGDAPVVIGELERLGDGFDDAVAGGVTVLVVGGGSRVQVGGGNHRSEGLLAVEGADALEPCIGNDRNGMVADHAVGIGLAERPHGQTAVTGVHVQQAEDHVLHERAVEQHLEGIPTAEGIPEGEGGIIIPPGGNLRDFLGVVAVAAVGVGLEVRRDECMVQCGIEGPALLRGTALDGHLAQPPGPFETRGGADVVETVAGGLREAVVLGPGHIDR